ncbi:MAG: HAD family hydrolase [Cyanobacteria bacterium]|nr:HAD family hydrolase [Cyanobacteriota bacterium]MDA1021096.1 HAD family hydrolase [Cyanobacteriota bacterium]
MKPNFSQNIIALVWDFDKTLIPYYMQKPLFQHYNVDDLQFWAEVNQLPAFYRQQGVTMSPDTAYLNHILSYVKKGKFAGLSNSKLRELGGGLDFFPGLPEFFHELSNIAQAEEEYAKFDIKVEHYIVSTGLTEVIRGSILSDLVKGIWGCEFIEQEGQIDSIAYQIDNTTKTRALFEINKGVNVHPEDISVNQSMTDADRRVPFENMIYIADGPSDIPAFSVVRKNNGKGFAVYNKDNIKSFKQAKQLLEDNRVDMFGEADYRPGTITNLWLREQIQTIADRIVSDKKSKLRETRESVPHHLN